MVSNMTFDYRAQGKYSKEFIRRSLVSEKKPGVNYILNKLDGFFEEKKSVLDLGCAEGVLGSEIKKRYGCDVFGIEINKNAIKQAQKMGVKVRAADLENKWPFPDNSFDVVMATQIIEHVINTDNIILEAKRVLKKSGLLIITTPNLASWFNRIIFLFGFQPFYTEISLKDKTLGLKFTRNLTKNREPIGHIRVFTLKGLRDLLEYHQFKIAAVKGGSIYYLPSFMKPVDNFFSRFPPLAADLIVVAVK